MPVITDRDRRWWILAVLGVAQLMIVVDISIVNIALPSAQRALHITAADRQWVITAYTLAFGGLLLLGGRVADYMGRKRILIVGLLGFAGASAIGGLAPDAGMLFAARGLQGAFAALMAPAGLSLLSVTFREPHERARAFGVYGAIAGGGLAIGLIAGGLLTQYASWRWCLLVNAPIAVAAGLAAARIVPESRNRGRTRYDLPGAVTSTLGMVALVYGLSEASLHGWGAATTVGLLLAAGVLLGVFLLVEARIRNPLLPLRVVTDRNRGGSYLTMLLVGIGLMGTMLFLTFYMQLTLHYSPLKTGVSYLPFSAGIVVSATVASKLIVRFRPRGVMAVGLLMAAAGMLWFARLGVHSHYWAHIAPAEILMSLGMGLVFVPVSNTGLFRLRAGDSGVASATINTSQQIGGSIGTALLNTIDVTATTAYLHSHLPAGLGATAAAGGGAAAGATARAAAAKAAAAITAHALVHGYSVAFYVGAAVLGLSIVAVLALIDAPASAAPDLVGAGEDALPVAV